MEIQENVIIPSYENDIDLYNYEFYINGITWSYITEINAHIWEKLLYAIIFFTGQQTYVLEIMLIRTIKKIGYSTFTTIYFFYCLK